MIQQRVSHGWEVGLSTPAGMPRWGHRLARAWVDWHSTGGDEPPFPTSKPSNLSFLCASAPLWQILRQLELG
jgi:hypothetical protein